MSKGPVGTGPPATGPVAPASALQAQPEKPQHYTYLKEFRTEQCPLFVQHKCTQHRPYTCFHWHFVNQRRRRSIRRRDGTFNYSPDIYCTKYDETTGICPEGDECPFLHRTTGDTERRYHLRYYKTGICIHETDSKGNCTKNGLHCAFAHGPHDLRSPVYDIRELQAMEALQNGQTTSESGIEGQSAVAASHAMIEKILSEEPRWQDTTYVLGNYKTEQCKKPPRLCRQGYACPYYHNSKDRRRSPRKHKYRSSPCPSVKHGDEWGDPSKCDNGDACQYCHTRTEQQFHPEIYKSTKCNDMQQSGSCPRGPFCAFAHVEQPPLSEDLQPTSAVSSPTQAGPVMYMPSAAGDSVPVSPSSPQAPDLSNVWNKPGTLPTSPTSATILCRNSSLGSPSNLCGSPPGAIGKPHSLESIGFPTDSVTTGSSYKKAPGFEREDLVGAEYLKNFKCQQAKIKSHSMEHRTQEQPLLQPKQDILGILPVGSPLTSSISSSITSSLAATPPSPAGTSSVPGMNANALPFYPTSDTVESVIESALDDLDLNEFGVAALEKTFDSSSVPHTSGIMIGGSLLQSSAPVNIPGSLGSSASFHSASPSPPVSLSSHFLHQSQGHLSQSENTFLGTSASHGSLGPGAAELARLRQELDEANSTIKQWEDSWKQAKQACDAWKKEAEEANDRASTATLECELAREQRETLELQVKKLQEEIERIHTGQDPQFLRSFSDLENLSLSTLYNLQKQLRANLERVDKAVFQMQSVKCLKCQEENRVVLPCQHTVLCETCAEEGECPICHPNRPHALQS
ncbi:RING finger protein unkempt homolog isoform X2 [Pantherophis guttatus]|uniref:RING finger protein unkempt homolog isoform X2 n=1 Tax=Pantherophis guttatus TaxID=94885 RepID=A0A6P9B925_PANGU|nr:RING finger protein unkempt homolog isoform X2 [Pantherophis guttatus]XP_060547006.1 RING finger protein unkempt homolog isoform X2 [Pantherophis guttatus]